MKATFLGWLLTFLLVAAFTGCTGSHVMSCVVVNGTKVCFIREVWGPNGDRVTLSTTENVCHKPVESEDYVSDSLRSSESVRYKVEDGKLYLYAEPTTKPVKGFPVEIIEAPYDPMESETDFRRQGWLEAPLNTSKMTWCFSDLF